MPLYEYQCEKCGSRFAARRSIAARDEGVVCPDCAAAEIVRLVPMFAAFTHEDGGRTKSIGPSPCSGCAGADCQTCGVPR